MRDLYRRFMMHSAGLDDEQRRQAQLINLVTLTGLLGIVAYAIFIVLGPASRVPVRLIVTVTVVVLPVQVLLRRRHFRFASIWLVTGVWIVYTISLYQLAGYRTPLAIFYMVVIFLAGIMLGRAAGVVTALFSIAALFAAVYLGSQGIIPAVPPPDFDSTAPSIYAFTVISFLLGALLQLQSTTSTMRALDREREAARELEALAQTLEDRVQDRTRDLVVATEVGRAISQVRDLNMLLADAVNLIGQRFDLYYAQVYLLDALERNLILRAGTGLVGAQLLERGHRLPLSMDSINGTAALERNAVIVRDTHASPIFRPNELLPNTRSEMSVPLLAGERVVGVLNMQSDRPENFSEENLPAFETLAGQLAVAIENANLFTETEAAQEALSAQARRLVSSGWRQFLNGIERPRRLGYVYDRLQLRPLEESTATAADTRAVPIAIAGQAIGAIQVESDAWTEEEEEIVGFVARQVAQQIDTLRLMAETERYREEAEEAIREAVRENWQRHMDEMGLDGFVYNGWQVKGLKVDKQDTAPPAVRAPLVIQGEEIGELGFVADDQVDPEAEELVSKVASRLAEHLETLRLSEQTALALTQTEVLYQGSDHIVRARNFDEALSSLVEFSALRDFDYASIAFFDRPWGTETPETITIAATWSGNREGVPEMYQIGASYPAAMWAGVLQNNYPTIFSDLDSEDEGVPPEIRTMVRDEMGLRTLVMFPLVAGGVWYGILSGQSLRRRALTESELRQLNSLTDQAAAVVQGLRLLGDARRRAERERQVREITDKIRRGTGRDTILQIARQELGQMLNARRAHATLGTREQLLSRLQRTSNGDNETGNGHGQLE